MNIEKDITALSTNIVEIKDALKNHAENSRIEIEKNGALTKDTKAKVDELLVKQGELSARLSAAEQLVVKLEQGGASVHAAVKSAGRTFTDSDAFKSFSGRGQVGVSMPRAAITSLTTSAGDLIVPDHRGLILPTARRLTIRDLIAAGSTTSNAVEFVKETGFTNNAAPVSENPAASKPESDLVYDLTSVPVATLAHKIKASKQVLRDAAQLASQIDARLRYGLKLVEENQLLMGSGVGLNINGIYTQASAYANPGVTIVNETSIDRLRVALLQAALAEYDADGIVLHPQDWAEIELTKTSDNAYLFTNPQAMTGAMLWGRPVIPTQAMTAGQFLVGAFQLGAQVFDNEEINVLVSTEDGDNFSKNMVTILCEERLALAVYRPEAFVKGALV
jgi:HK97 family phage major capsid protein